MFTMETCFFSTIIEGCIAKTERLSTSREGSESIPNIIKKSKERKDCVHKDLEKRYNENKSMTITYHLTCASTYKSNYHVKKYLKHTFGETSSNSGPTPAKRVCSRSEADPFDFLKHCIFCGKICSLEPDKKNPRRYRQASLCRTADRIGQKTFKEAILDVCKSRNDKIAREIEIRLSGALSDLHAADARYHQDCRKKIMNTRAVQAASRTIEDETDAAFDSIISDMKKDRERMWTSVDIQIAYSEHGGCHLSRHEIVKKIIATFGGEAILFSSPGLANIIIFRHKASTILRLAEVNEDDKTLEHVAKRIVKDCKELKRDRDAYNTMPDKDSSIAESSETILMLLGCLSPRLNMTLPALLISNIITSVLTNQPTSLQVALAVHTQEKKKLETLSSFGVTCSYDEMLRFKASAAATAAKELNSTANPITDTRHGLIQAVADNFDANISSQNGLKSTHALALLLTQPKSQGVTSSGPETIVRIGKQDMTKELIPNLEIQRYLGKKKPEMPVQFHFVTCQVPTLKSLAAKANARNKDFLFLKNVVSEPGTPEFAGYNVKLSREQDKEMKPATQTLYRPLIDMIPADPDCMKTAMVEAQRITNKCGQTYTVFTADQQLYRVMLNVLWVHPETFPNFVPRLGGMHMLMSYVGSIGNLMTNSGLEEVLGAAFGGVKRMLSGKNFPQNVRALRMVVEEVLHEVIQGVGNHEELFQRLEDQANRSRTTKLWLDCLIKPVLIMMLYIRAEREAEWLLHLLAVEMMLPYFFASGHVNYARYGLYYLRNMEHLPKEVLDTFLKGQHVMRHKRGLWNAMWSDMFIETTFMRYGHGPGGLIGITLKDSTIQRWALSLHTSSRLLKCLSDLTEGSKQDFLDTHKEEANTRIASDALDREKLRGKLETCINPLSAVDHPDYIVNIVNGKVSPQSVNVDKSVCIGNNEMKEFEKTWPHGFYKTLSTKVITMAAGKKSVQSDHGPIYDTGLIYSRAMGLMACRDFDMESLFKYELAPLPTSLFNDSGDMRTATTKAVLKRTLQESVSARVALDPEIVILDGCALFYCVNWPSKGTVHDFVNSFWSLILSKMDKSHVYLVFDRYHEFSIKSATRQNRNTKACTIHKLTTTTPLPAQTSILANTENKKQLISILCKELKSRAVAQSIDKHLIITGHEDAPFEITNGNFIQRTDLATTHEEADVIVVQQAMHAASLTNAVKVISDDTDVFILLVHFYHKLELSSNHCSMMMEATSGERALVDIGKTVARNQEIAPYLLAAHALSGCDTVAKPYGIGKKTVIKVLRQGHRLDKLGDIICANFEDVIKEASSFMTACYGVDDHATMTGARYKIWLKKTGKKNIKKIPDLKTIPATSEAFCENTKRGHIQTAIWYNALHKDPPEIRPTDFGWMKVPATKSLAPITLPSNTPSVPPELLETIRCGCSSEQPCGSSRCGCVAAQLPCTLFCKCHDNENCQNRLHQAASVSSDESSDEDTDDE